MAACHDTFPTTSVLPKTCLIQYFPYAILKSNSANSVCCTLFSIWNMVFAVVQGPQGSTHGSRTCGLSYSAFN